MREAADHGQIQESNSGDVDLTCMSIQKPNIHGISLPVNEQTFLPQPCTGRWWNLRSGLLGPACLCFALLLTRFIQAEAFEKLSPFHPGRSP